MRKKKREIERGREAGSLARGWGRREKRRAQACERGFTDPFLRNPWARCSKKPPWRGREDTPRSARFCNTTHGLKQTGTWRAGTCLHLCSQLQTIKAFNHQEELAGFTIQGLTFFAPGSFPTWLAHGLYSLCEMSCRKVNNLPTAAKICG